MVRLAATINVGPIVGIDAAWFVTPDHGDVPIDAQGEHATEFTFSLTEHRKRSASK